MYIITIEMNEYKVYGMDIAYEVYMRAVNFAETIGLECDLVDGETGEVLMENGEQA